MTAEDAESVPANSDDPDRLSYHETSSVSRSQNSPSIPAEGDWIEAAELDADRWVKAEDMDQLWGEAAVPSRKWQVNNLPTCLQSTPTDTQAHSKSDLQLPEADGSTQQVHRVSMSAHDTLDIAEPAPKRARLTPSPIRAKSPSYPSTQDAFASHHMLIPVDPSADQPVPLQPACKEETVITEAAAQSNSESDTGSSGDVSASMRHVHAARHADMGSPLSELVGSASGDENLGDQEAQASSHDFGSDEDSESSDGFEGVPSRYCINCTSRLLPGDVLCVDCGHAPSQDEELFDQRQAQQPSPLPPPQSVVLAYDERMTLHVEGPHSSHPERPDRIRAVMARLTASGLTDQCQQLPVREATVAEVTACHGPGHMGRVAAKASMAAADAMTGGPGRTHFSPDTYLNQHTLLCARLAAGACADTAVAVVRQEAATGVAIVRPPGHHAESNTAMGFCFFNNAAIAARAAQAAGAERVLILDWDVHHGNGTQEIFEEDPSVMYMSIHRHDRGMFYPGTGAHDATGIGPGEGFSVNVPWLTGNMGNGDYLAAFQHVLLPIAYQFNPSLVIVSAGFDAAVGDPIGGCKVTEGCFGHMTAMLQPIAPMAVLLEGGYNLSATAASTEACLRVLLGQRPAALPFEDRAPSAAGLAALQQVIHTQAKYWSCLRGLLPALQPIVPVQKELSLYSHSDPASAVFGLATASKQYHTALPDVALLSAVVSSPREPEQQKASSLQHAGSKNVSAHASDGWPASLHQPHADCTAESIDADHADPEAPPDAAQQSCGPVHSDVELVHATDQSAGHRLLAEGQKPRAHAPKGMHRTRPHPQMCQSKSHKHLMFMRALHASAQKQIRRQHKHVTEMKRQGSI